MKSENKSQDTGFYTENIISIKFFRLYLQECMIWGGDFFFAKVKTNKKNLRANMMPGVGFR